MSPAPDPSPAENAQLEGFLQRAMRRVRFERFRFIFGALVRVLLVVAIAWALAIQWRPEWALGVPIGLWLGGILLLLAADAALFWQVDRGQALRRLDSQLGLADSVTSAKELETAETTVRPVWRQRQLAQTLHELHTRSWDDYWPRRWPRLTGLATLGLLLFGGLLFLEYQNAVANVPPRVSPLLKDQLNSIEQVFRDWEEAAKKTEDPELQRMLQELKPMREKMAAGEMREREVMVALSRVEEKLEAQRKSLAEKSLEPSAGEMAAALEPMAGMSALSAALRRKDFEQAEKLAADRAEQLAQPEAKMPEGAKDQANQQRMEKAAQNLAQRKQEAAQQAMQKMGEGMKQGDAKQMSQGMKGLSQALGSESKRQSESKRLSTQLAQMGQCKECMGNGQCMGRGMSLMPQLATKKSPPGKGAGSAIDPNRFGAPTEMAANRTEEKITGQVGEGDSETTTQKSDQNQREIAAGARSGNFQAYEKLSREAIDDENIPVAHRQTIRKYFEMIRPAER